jgi:hypothetical protein
MIDKADRAGVSAALDCIGAKGSVLTSLVPGYAMVRKMINFMGNMLNVHFLDVSQR